MEKMRVSARECRLRKKNNIATLETKLEEYEIKDKRNRTLIVRLKDDVRRLQDHLRSLGGGNRAVETYDTVAQSVATLTNMYAGKTKPAAASRGHDHSSSSKATPFTTTGTTGSRTTMAPANRSRNMHERSGLVIDTSTSVKLEAPTGRIHPAHHPRATSGPVVAPPVGGIFSKQLSNVVASQQHEQVSMSPITPRLSQQFDSIVESGFMLPTSPRAGQAFNFNFDSVDILQTQGLG